MLINNLEKDIKSKVKFFADDTMVFDIVNDPCLTARDLNLDLINIQRWAHRSLETNSRHKLSTSTPIL